MYICGKYAVNMHSYITIKIKPLYEKSIFFNNRANIILHVAVFNIYIYDLRSLVYAFIFARSHIHYRNFMC